MASAGLEVFLSVLQIPFYFLLEIYYFVLGCRPRKEIKNQHVLITGSAEGIGAQFALQFAEMGNTVHCLDYNEDLNEKMVEDLKAKGYTAYAYTCDLRKWEELEAVYNQITEKGFVITYLINNAGIAYGREISTLTFTQIQASVQIMLVAQLWTVKLFLPKMKEINEGHIVNIASLAGVGCMLKSTDYCAAKAGSIHLTNQLRFELVKTNLNFSAVCPFFVGTRMITGIDDDLESIGLNVMTPRVLVQRAMIGIQENREMIIVPKSIGYFFNAMKMLPQHVLKTLNRTSKLHDVQDDKKDFIGQRMTEKIR